jgi:hypothetical protein
MSGTWQLLLVAFLIVAWPNLTRSATGADHAVFNVIRGADSCDQPQGDAHLVGKPQMNLTINIPEELYQCARQIAAAENVSVEELFASAFEERILEFERLREKAARGSYEKFRQVMAKISAVEPLEHDRL